ncbi:MAG: glutamate synthase subunit beta [Rectinemataceae bacterium]
MAKPTGFIEYERALPPDRPPAERVGDWKEFHEAFGAEEESRIQAARCMDCGTPFCHSGVLYEGAVSGCPIHNLIPEWNDLVYRGLWLEALGRLRLTDNFPEFTGRVCPAPCEGACTLGSIPKQAVAIKNNEASIVDRGWEEKWMEPARPAKRTGKRVAVVGSGPAGLACADQLNQAGHEVTVYERADRVGGILTYGIPNMKLDKKIVARRVDLMAAEGVRFVTGVEVGNGGGRGSRASLSAKEVRGKHDAVVLACGSTRPRDLAVEGRDLGGIHFAIEYLTANTKSLLASDRAERAFISAEGRDVVIIGGGDTGTDCLGTAIRQGAKSVTQLEIMSRAPDGRAADNPWPEWPKTLKTDYGQEEAAALFGRDPRIFQVTAKRFLGDAEGRVSGLTVVDVEWNRDAKGRLSPRERPGSERNLSAALVLIAMGFLGPEEELLKAFEVEADERGNAKAAYGVFATGTTGVFAAGDMRRGQSLVVWAIAEGRGAAREVDRYLMGSTRLP